MEASGALWEVLCIIMFPLYCTTIQTLWVTSDSASFHVLDHDDHVLDSIILIR